MNNPAQLFPRFLLAKSPWKDKLVHVMPRVLNVVLIILCSYTLSQITWLLIPQDQAQLSAPPPQKRTTAPTTPSSRNYNTLSNAHLYGKYEAAPAQKQATTEAPETRLNLVLRGVLAATPMKSASAIIALGKNGKEETYVVGDQVSSATLSEVHDDRVILDRGGRLETLKLPSEYDDSFIQSNQDTDELPVSPDSGDAGSVLSGIREQIVKNPTSFSQYALPVPYNENGQLRGYRLKPQGDRALFDSVGLDPDDVIISVNGMDLNNPATAIKALRNLQSADQLNLVILRDGAEMPLQFELP